MKLILLRHGVTEANEAHLYCGATDLPLSEKGKKALCEKKDSGALPDITGFNIITSGAERCNETLRLLFGNTEHSEEPDFLEINFGNFEMHSYEQLKNDESYIKWISGDNESNITPNGESGNMMTKRVLSALGKITKKNSDTLIVTHGGPIAAIMAHLFEKENKNRYEWQPSPGGGYIIDTEKNTYTKF